MTTRRNFLKTGGLSLASLMVGQHSFARMAEKADDMMKALADKAVEYLTWYLSMDDNRFSISTREFEYHWAVLDAEVKIMKKYNSKLAEIYAPKVEELYNLYAERYERLQKMEKK